MSIIFMTTSVADLTAYDTNQVVASTTAAKLAPYVPEGIQMNYINNSDGADTPNLTFTFPATFNAAVELLPTMSIYGTAIVPSGPIQEIPIKAMSRSAGVDLIQDTAFAPDGYVPNGKAGMFYTDPATGAAWTKSAVLAAQLGLVTGGA